MQCIELKLIFVFTDSENRNIEPNFDDTEHEIEGTKETRSAVLLKEFIPIDLNHPVVKELLDMGYELERCLEAAARFPDDVTRAHEYLIESGDKGELFSSSIQTCGFDNNGPLWHSDSSLLMEVDVEEEIAQPLTSGSHKMIILKDHKSLKEFLTLPELSTVLSKLSDLLPSKLLLDYHNNKHV